MLQDIAPRVYRCEYHQDAPVGRDFVMLFDNSKALLKVGDCNVRNGDECVKVHVPMTQTPMTQTQRNDRTDATGSDGELTLLRLEDLPLQMASDLADASSFCYLFSVDQDKFFLVNNFGNNTEATGTNAGLLANFGVWNNESFVWVDSFMFRQLLPSWMGFAGITAHQLYLWYCGHVYCGYCGAPTQHDATERMLECPICGQQVYPKIAPVEIAAVTNGEKLLLTRYAGGRYSRYALVAGFVEVGETFEAAVRREVYEETGVRVKNIRYYKSQPWGFSSSLLAGFVCELDGDPTITIDTVELAEAVWLGRSDIPPTDDVLALTTEMIEAFRAGTL